MNKECDLMDSKTILRWETAGFFIIAIVGSLLHFCFEWSGYFKPLALFCAVNESVWEHLKLGFWPALVFALLEYALWGKFYKNFWVGKALALYTIPATIILLFYTYTAIAGTHFLIADIAVFIASILLSQIVSFRIITSNTDFSSLRHVSTVLLIILTAAFCLLTFFPPKLKLFMDPQTGKYGIPAKM